MKIASVAEVKSRFSAFLKASEGGPVVVTRNGRPVAVIVGIQDEDEIERLLMAYSPHLRAILDRSRQQFREGSGSAKRNSGRSSNPTGLPGHRLSQGGRGPNEPLCHKRPRGSAATGSEGCQHRGRCL